MKLIKPDPKNRKQRDVAEEILLKGPEYARPNRGGFQYVSFDYMQQE